MLNRARIAVFVSGGGTNLQALLDAQKNGAIPHGEIALVVSSQAGAYALERAKNAGVPAQTVPSSLVQQDFERAIEHLLAAYKIERYSACRFFEHSERELYKKMAAPHFEYPPLADSVVLRQGNVRSQGT